jgi:hypothetical protein
MCFLGTRVRSSTVALGEPITYKELPSVQKRDGGNLGRVNRNRTFLRRNIVPYQRRDRAPIGLHADWAIVFEHLLGSCPAMSRIVSSEASPLSARSAMKVCLQSCQRSAMPASSFTLAHAVLQLVAGRFGSVGWGLPKGKTSKQAKQSLARGGERQTHNARV